MKREAYFVLATSIDGADAKTLRETIDQLRDKLKSAVIVLASVDGRKVTLSAEVRDALEVVGRGLHRRFVIDTQRHAARLEEKLAALPPRA